MDNYLIYKVYPDIQAYIEDLANWFVKFNRNRMKGRNITKEEQSACLSTCWNVLFTLSKVLAPFAPFISETFYQHLKVLLPTDQQMQSVHLCDFPQPNEFQHDAEIERKMSRLQHVASINRNLRVNSKTHTSVKMPIESIQVLVNDPTYIDDIKELQQYLIEDANCFTITYGNMNGLINYNIKPDHKAIGQTYREKANDIKMALSTLSADVIEAFATNQIDHITVTVNNVDYHLGRDCVHSLTSQNYNVKPNEAAKLEGNVMVICNFECTPRVIKFNTKSMIIRAIQDLRKTTKLHSWDRIGIYYNTDDKYILQVLNEFHDEISANLGYEIKDDKDRSTNEETIIESNCTIDNVDVHVRITRT
jgi:isoleucyl-tRNA synthetase